MTNTTFAALVSSLLLLIVVACWQFWTLAATDHLSRTETETMPSSTPAAAATHRN